MKIWCATMNDIEKLVDFAALFFAAINILFGIWFPDLSRLSNKAMPPVYRNRKAYIEEIQISIFSKSLPLLTFQLGFIIAMSQSIIDILCNTSFTLVPKDISPIYTLAAISIAISIYLVLLVLYNLIMLLKNWYKSGEGRDDGPRISTFR